LYLNFFGDVVVNRRIKNLEFRWGTEQLPCRFPEIIAWNFSNNSDQEYCYTLARWEKTSEGYDLKFIGSRPFQDEIDSNLFWELAKYGQKIVDADFDLEYRTTDT
jgi:hypothetical protein